MASKQNVCAPHPRPSSPLAPRHRPGCARCLPRSRGRDGGQPRALSASVEQISRSQRCMERENLVAEAQGFSNAKPSLHTTPFHAYLLSVAPSLRQQSLTRCPCSVQKRRDQHPARPRRCQQVKTQRGKSAHSGKMWPGRNARQALLRQATPSDGPTAPSPSPPAPPAPTALAATGGPRPSATPGPIPGLRARRGRSGAGG